MMRIVYGYGEIWEGCQYSLGEGLADVINFYKFFEMFEDYELMLMD